MLGFPPKSTLSALGIALFGLAVPLQAAETKYPLTIENCGFELTYPQAPQRITTVGQTTTEILYSLGLGDRVVGTSVWFTDVLEEYKETDAKVPRISDNQPSFEGIVKLKPDLVTVQYEWWVGAKGTVATREQFHELGINSYVMLDQCVDQDSTKGSDGTRTALFRIETLYDSIKDIATIFNVSDRGEKLVSELTKRENDAANLANNLRADGVSALFWFSSADMEMDPYVAGTMGVPAYMMSKLGLRNVIESNEVWPTVGWEWIIKSDPDIIVIAKMERRRFEADDYTKKLEFLQTDPVAREMKAVKNNHIVIMDGTGMDPSIRSIDGIAQLAEAVKKFGMTKN